MNKFYIISLILLVIIVSIAIPFIASQKSSPITRERPYVQNEILYLTLKEIPINDIIRIEIVKNPIIYVIIHHKDGMYSLPYSDYLKFVGDLC